MPYVNNTNDDKSYASSGVGTAALVMSIFGAAGAAGLLNGGLGNIFGGNQNAQNPAASSVYQLASKDNEIALLKAQQYSDNKDAAILEKIAKVDARVIALETAAPLRDKILSDSILNLNTQLAEISVRKVPNWALAPGYGPAVVGAVPPPGYVLQPVVQSGTSTPTPTNSGSSQS